MQPSNTYFGFRANKDLGGGMKAIAQLEQSVPLDEGTVTANSAGLITPSATAIPSWAWTPTGAR